MTQDRFLNMMSDTELLATISFQELKTLALAYPYAHNLRYLLAIKAQQDHHPEFERTLAAASAYSLHRPQLFRLIAPQKVGQEEEVLELKAIEALQRELEARAPIAREEDKHEAPLVRQQLPPAPETPPASPIEISGERPVQIRPQSEAPLGFGDWLDQFNLQALEPRAPRPSEPFKTEKNLKKASPPPTVSQSLAEKSVAEREEVVSETMARLFAAQGHRERAIALYERLSLAFPEKSDYFAAEIDKLKK